MTEGPGATGSRVTTRTNGLPSRVGRLERLGPENTAGEGRDQRRGKGGTSRELVADLVRGRGVTLVPFGSIPREDNMIKVVVLLRRPQSWTRETGADQPRSRQEVEA